MSRLGGMALRKWVLAFAVVTMVATACGSGDVSDTTSSTDAAPSTTAGTSQPSGAPEAAFAAEFDEGLVEELAALEAANDGQWTVDNAVRALELLKPALREGVDSYPPISVMELLWFLNENAEDLTEEQREIILGAPAFEQNAVPAAYWATGEAERAGYERLAEQASAEFSRLTGNRFGGEIVVALSSYGLFPGDSSWAVTSSQFELVPLWEALSPMFPTLAEAQRMEELFLEATADGDVACVMVLGEVLRQASERQQAAGIMHEVAHCHQHDAHPGGVGRFFATSTPWFDEGYASWAGEAFVGGTPQSRRWWDGYHEGEGPIGGHDPVDGAYANIALFSYLHDNGVDGWANFDHYFTRIRATGETTPESRLKLSAVVSLLPEEALVNWAATSLRRPELSDLWDYTTGPGIGQSRIARMPREVPMAVGRERSFSTSPGEQGTYALQPDLRDATALLFELEVLGPGVVRWPWGVDETSGSAFAAAWCFGPECVCDDGTELGPAAPEFTESNEVLVAVTGGSFTAVLKDPEEECEKEKEPPAAGVCPVGVWAIDPEIFAGPLLATYRNLGVADPTYESGNIHLALLEDGSFRLDYLKTTFAAEIRTNDGEFVFNGGSFGSWEEDGSTLSLTIEGLDIVANLFVDGQRFLTLPVPTSTGAGSLEYSCNGNDVMLLEGSPPLQGWNGEWTRVGP